MEKRRILALGRQEFAQVIGDNCIYVDKTKLISDLITTGKYYFLSRPRRFGKSLLANTIKELFLGNKALFKGLWIYNKWDWTKKNPVIKISFAATSHIDLGLKQAIHNQLDDIGKSKGIEFEKRSYSEKFKELIIKLSEKEKVAIIIDEYDKPIIDHIGEPPKTGKTKSVAEEKRDILKNFYSVLKDLDNHIRFFFVTGVSKFSRVSIFSDLNNLTDITLDRQYASITGWTRDEIESNFPDYLETIKHEYKEYYTDIWIPIKEWYDGYSWDGKTFLYNPVSIMNFLSQQAFRNYWFATGTPTFLINFIKQQEVLPYHIEQTVVTSTSFEKYEIENLTLLPLLFQTGYLTIKKIDILNDEYTLEYPNREVARSFSEYFLAEHTTGKFDVADTLLIKIRKNLEQNKIDDLIENINALFSGISYTLVEKSEKYFHSLFYLVLKILGYNIETEILTIKRRIDAVIKSQTHIYIIEFKINQPADKAIEQIREKQYADRYKNDKRKIVLLGINFNTENKNINDYLVF